MSIQSHYWWKGSVFGASLNVSDPLCCGCRDCPFLALDLGQRQTLAQGQT